MITRREAGAAGAGTLLALALAFALGGGSGGAMAESLADTQGACGKLASADIGESAAEPQRLVEEAEELLATGRPQDALRILECLTTKVHVAAVELALVRSQMQMGEYRRALAFGAHAAGAHREVPAGMALYAWLLRVGGQEAAASSTLKEALTRAPLDPVLVEARTALSVPWPAPAGLLRRGPWRMTPYAWGETVPAASRLLGNGVLLYGGNAALVPTVAIEGSHRIWVRNGLGQTSEATVERALEGTPLTHLRLRTALVVPTPVPYATREPYGGSPGYLFEYAPTSEGDPAWPLLRMGFLAAAPPGGGSRPLGIGAPVGSRGGPVLGADGSLTGIAIVDRDKSDRLLPMVALPSDLQGLPVLAEPPSNARVSPDEAYERGLGIALQVIGLR